MAKQTLLSLQSNDLQNVDEIQLSHDETAMCGNCLVDCQSSTIPANQVMNVEFTKPADDTYYLPVEIVSEGKFSKGQNSVNVYSSSDEEEESASKNQETRTKRSRRHPKDKRPSLNKIIYSLPLEMPVVAKGGCLNSSWYISLMAELKDLQDNGDFEGHEQRIQKELAEKRAENIDLQASLKIERAVALYMQGNDNLEKAKKIAKDVLNLEEEMTNPEVLTARALNLLTSIYKSQRKFVKARKCVEQATTALKYHDSPVDRAELYQSYAGLSTEETAMGGNCLVDCQSSTIPANQVMNVEFKKLADDTYYSTVSGAKLVKIVFEGKVSKGQNSVNVDSSSDEEEESASKNQEIRTKRSRRHPKDKQPSLNKIIYSLPLEMPVVAKRGCLNSSWYICLIAKLKDLQDNGDFEGHERLIQKELAERPSKNTDLRASLQIECAVALYMQGNVKEAKKIAKEVLDLEKQMENPEVLTARALNLLTSIYKTQTKFGNAWICVQQATTALKYHDSPVDRAELHQSYGGLISSMLAMGLCGISLKDEAYNSFTIALDCATDPVDMEYTIVKRAKLLLGSDKHVSEDDVLQAKKHLDSIEDGPDADNMAVGTKINLLLLRSDQFRLEGNVAMAMEKALEARALIEKYDGFERQLASAEKRIHHLSKILSPECGSSEGAVGDGSSSD